MLNQLFVEGSYNVRELGNYPTMDGHSTRSHILIRAGNLDKVSDTAQQQLIDYGVKTIVDLRDEWETQHYPNVFAASTTVKYLNLPLIGDTLNADENWKKEAKNYTSLDELYIKYLDRCHPQIGAIVTAIAKNPFTTLFHCYAGKDRTGIIAALLLAAVGVPDTLIAEDYAHSSSQITHLVTEWREYAVTHGQDMAQFERDVDSKPETILSMLDYLNQHYEGVTNYLHFCGVSHQQIELLQTHFVR